MNEYHKMLMPHESLLPGYCVICGTRPAEMHHVVRRSQGGANGPRMHLCGRGNTSGHHGEAHQNRLHFKWDNGWWWLETPAPLKYEKALELSGWKRI